jgi:hypothetical protein
MSLFLRLLGEADKGAALVGPASFDWRFTAEARRVQRRKEMRSAL